ncbi:MAG TPA: hypothetical protein VD931_02235 [Baekduia sp.]|nr:hypothetical protein [Baekduia sp.]
MRRRFAVVVVDAMAAPRDPALRDRLGPELDDHLRAVVRAHVVRWARAVPGEAYEAARGEDVPPLLHGHDGPVVLVAPDVPGLAPHHLHAACDDLDAGVTLAFGAAGDGLPFLLVLASPDPDLLRRAGDPFDDLAAIAAAGGGSFGMLRQERRLASVADARAWRADPVAPLGLRDLLAPVFPR